MSNDTLKPYVAAARLASVQGLSAEKAGELETQRLKFREEALANRLNNAWHAEQAAVQEKVLTKGFAATLPYLQQVFNIKTLGRDDRLTLREVEGLKVWEVARGGAIRESRVTNTRYEAPSTYLGFHTSVDDDEIAEWADNLPETLDYAADRFNMNFKKFMLNLLKASVPDDSDNYIEVASGGLTQDIITDAISLTRRRVSTSGAAPTQSTIAGSYDMISQILKFNVGFDPAAAEELRNTGILRRNMGADLMLLEDEVDEDGARLVAANELVVFSGQAAQFALLGTPTTEQWREPETSNRHYTSRQKIAGVVDHAEVVARVVDLEVSA